MEKWKYYIDALIVSGICSLIVAAILFLKSRNINNSPVEFAALFLIPCALTLIVNAAIITSIHSEKLKQRITSRLRGAKVVFISLIVLLIFFQLFFASGWIMNFTNKHTPTDMKLLGYFMLVGFACSVWLLYQVTEPKKIPSA